MKTLVGKLFATMMVMVYLIMGSMKLGTSIWKGPIGGVLRTLCFKGDTKIKLKGNFTTGKSGTFLFRGASRFSDPKRRIIIIQFIAQLSHPSETQQIIAKMLNQKSNSISVLVRRIGGGFGGKETNFMTSAICALLSHKTKKPIKLRLV